MTSPAFGALLRSMRTERGWSLRDLAERIRFNRAYIGKVEQCRKLPDRRFAELADRALDADGMLLAAWNVEADQRRESEATGRLLVASTRDSLRLARAGSGEVDLDDLDRGVRELAGAYMGSSPVPMLHRAVELRTEALRRLERRWYRPSELADLYLTVGRVQGVLAYAALDLGDAGAAMTHANAAWTCAGHAGDNELRAWVRGTQSLIARFDADYGRALAYVLDGLRYGATGTGRVRLLCGYAQCRANLGDSRGSNAALNHAVAARERLTGPDSLTGIFEFSEAKQQYYVGSSLIWLDGGPDAERAAHAAGEAISAWEREPTDSPSLDNELAHVYQATAYLQLGRLDAADAAIRPVLGLPRERRISWIRKRLARFAGLLRAAPYAGSRPAAHLYDEIQALAA